ncbi:DoxX family membrane protein [Bradyrhizobium sp. CSA112]|uniref:DoxX family protein n=1 Tax=Bradyrhizobium sp. CSA112 TaxID=2699170 RepID=UPI0023B07050|nr:DoxX family protein [Bradyrhizobium sp. CSA112]MDE5455648.1 DoxX family membrane protein [Bradyrhizobium sp. CSA112]
MSTIVAPARPYWTSAALWFVRGLLALVFVAAGGAKLYGVPMLVENFQHIGLGQWFRYVTGGLEIIGAILLLLPHKTVLGALLLICIMVGAVITHLFIIGGSAMPAIVLLALNAVVAYAERGQISSLAKTSPAKTLPAKTS